VTMSDLEEIWAWNSIEGGQDHDNKNFMRDMKQFLKASLNLHPDHGL
jgi:hypothetical protein